MTTSTVDPVPPDRAAADMRAAGLEPLTPYPGPEAWPCRCVTCGSEVAPRLRDVRNGSRCKICRTRAARAGEAERAAARMRAAGFEPLTPYPGSNASPWPCRCVTCGSEVAPRLRSVTAGQGGCRHCGAPGPVPPDRAAADMRAAGFEPLTEYPGSAIPWPCRCVTCGSEVAPRLSSVRNGQGGCRHCGGTAPVPPDRAAADMRAAGFEPLTEYPGCGAAWPCRCVTCGSEVAPRLNSVRNGHRCQICRARSRGRAARSGEADRAAADMRAAGFEPLTEYPGAKAPWPCRCVTCGSEVAPRLKSVRTGHHRCRHCDPAATVGGINVTGPAVVYLLWNGGHHSTKVGIAKVGSGRLARHAALGWEPFAVWSGFDGRTAYRLEREVLSLWRSWGIPPHLTADDMPQAGHTETACLTPDWVRVSVGWVDMWAAALAPGTRRVAGPALAANTAAVAAIPAGVGVWGPLGRPERPGWASGSS